MSAYLELRGVTRWFGGLMAVNDVSLGVERGELVGLIGPNGAGKTTLFNCVSGALRPQRGEVLFDGRRLTGAPMHQIARHGLVRTFQLSRLWANFTVLENVLSALYLHAGVRFWQTIVAPRRARSRESELERRARDILRLVGLGGRENEMAASLPHGLQRVLQIAIALAPEPKVLLLDEPVTGMNQVEVDEVMELVRRLRHERGLTAVLVEHNMRAVMGVCDRLAVLHFGRKIAEGTPDVIARNEEVVQAYLGVYDDASA
jgi:branched-chain amino acid transport system ATP-binding protein